MEDTGLAGPIVVCLDNEHDVALLVKCGIALARFFGVPLLLAFLLLIPPQRPLDFFTPEEERQANSLLDVATNLATASGVAAKTEIWAARNQAEAVQAAAEDLKASAVVVGWHGSGPFHLFDAGRSMLKDVPCPVIMVGQGAGHLLQEDWPPSWLLESYP